MSYNVTSCWASRINPIQALSWVLLHKNGSNISVIHHINLIINKYSIDKTSDLTRHMLRTPQHCSTVIFAATEFLFDTRLWQAESIESNHYNKDNSTRCVWSCSSENGWWRAPHPRICQNTSKSHNFHKTVLMPRSHFTYVFVRTSLMSVPPPFLPV